jgi:NAD(P)-dependent dehydrogenase (short-subunit alcohol dehydrogenase family)
VTGQSADPAAGVLDRFRLDGRVAIVTGASSGLGVAFAAGLAEAGADVVLTARRADRLQRTRQLVEQHGRRALAVPADITDSRDCERVAAAACQEFGAVHILVNNAGTATAVPATRESPEEFSRVVATNLHGSYWMAQACGRRMQPGATIINISSSLASTTAGLPQAAYAASKAGLLGLTRDLAAQWTGRKGIRVNALIPGYFRTDMTSHLPDGYLDTLISQRIPAGRLGNHIELVTALIFLASDASSYITGTTLTVDGGLLIT